ncbi:MAG: membrane protein insertion efficiency factor YidD [Nitrospirae bacterium]|nr:MAG: membrane protein insertion efficiency factor YidD [Nitrospirota bacterium]
MKILLISIIKFYKNFISPFLPGACRFVPSCSEYAMDAIRLHGALRGLYLASRRILKCHPFHPGGFDPVKQR